MLTIGRKTSELQKTSSNRDRDSVRAIVSLQFVNHASDVKVALAAPFYLNLQCHLVVIDDRHGAQLSQLHEAGIALFA
jgi:hypothetical protein